MSTWLRNTNVGPKLNLKDENGGQMSLLSQGNNVSKFGATRSE